MAAASGFLALPIALRVLGATDFGIFSVIAGSLTVLLFINGALTGGAQRHIAYALGAGSKDEAARWFAASLIIHATLALTILVVALSCSHWVIHRVLSLPGPRLGAALWTYRAVVLVLFCSIISTPYQALLMAKESFTALYLMAMAGSLLLIIGVVALKALPGDKLIWYAAINAASDVFVIAGPVFYCVVRYAECRQSSLASPRKIQNLLSFSGWNLLGTLAVQIRYQGPAILFNRFFGTTANAANGIAMQVNGFAANVSTAFLSATTPPIVKAEARGDRREALFVSNLSNKYAFLLLWLFLGPVLFSLKYCLTLWLHQMPADTVTFSTALLVVLLVDMLTAGFMAVVQAEGRIATYQCVIGILLCVSVPLGFVLLRMRMPPGSVWWAALGGSVLAGAGRLWFLRRKFGFQVVDWLENALRPCLVTALACSSAMLLVLFFSNTGFARLLCLYLVNSGIVFLLTWAFARSDQERRLAESFASRFQRGVFSETRRVFAFALRRS